MYIGVTIGELLVFTPAMRSLSWWWSVGSWQESGQTYLEIESFCYMMPNRCGDRGIFYLQIEKESGRAEHEKQGSLSSLLVYSWWWRDESCLLSVMNHEDLMKCHRSALMPPVLHHHHHNPPVPYDLCVGIPISCLLTVG